MTKNLFNVDDSEKMRILEMHQSATSRHYLGEQSVEQSADATNNPQAIPVSGKAASIGFNEGIIKSINTKVRNNITNKVTTESDQTKLVQQLEGDQLYEQLLLAFKRAYSVDTIKIWFSQLTQESRLVFLQQFTEWWNASSKKVQSGKRLIKANIDKAGRPRVEKIDAVEDPDQPESEPIFVGLEMVGGDVYSDNKSEITPTLQNKINELLSQAKQAVDIAAQTNASVTCDKISVAASCSRLRNTEGAANMTWEDLSKARANNVTEAIKTGLKSVGVIVPDSISIELRGGYNGDGTSGPNPAKPKSLTTDGKTIVTDEKLRNQQFPIVPGTITQPSTNVVDYDPFKFCIANCTLKTTWVQPPTPESKTLEFKRFKSYQMEISEIRPVRGNPRMMNFKTIKWNTPTNKVFGRLTACPIF